MSCPTQEALTAFVLGEPTNMDEIAAHVEGCAACTRFLDGVVEEAYDSWQQYLEESSQSGEANETL